MDLRRLVDPRSSFAAKVAVALLGTVGLLLAVMLFVVRAETRGQVQQVTDETVDRAQRAFEESEQRRREELARLAEILTNNRRTQALIEAAIEAGEASPDLVADLGYQLNLINQDPRTITVFTNLEGEPQVTLLGGRPASEIDPAAVAPLTDQLLAGTTPELTGYRVVRGRLYTLHGIVLFIGARPIGTATSGLPIENEDVEALGRVVGAEICFVAAGECVAGTEMGRDALASTLVEAVEGEDRVMAQYDGERWELAVEPLTAEGPTEGHLAMAVPLERVLLPFDRIRGSLALGSAAAIVFALLLAVFISRGLTRPVRTLVEATRRVGRGEYDVRVPEESRDEMGQLAESFNVMTEGLALKEQYRGVLDKVVSRDVAEELLRGDVTLGGENREVTVLFADVREFTTLTEGMEPQQVIGLLNETMERLSDAVEEAGGVVDKYVGDEIMAVFGAPLAQPDHAERAARAALVMQTAMREVNEARRARSAPPVRIGVGIHCGEVVAGNMGSTNRLNYTVLGASVNLAARLCSAAAPGEILASEAVRDRLPEGVTAAPAGARDLKGFSQPVEVFALTADAGTEAGDRARERRAGSGASVVALACLGVAALLGLGAPAPAQSLPTLRDLGLEWISPEGTVQAGLSGRVDLEGYAPTGQAAPWIIPTTDAFGAGRARVFGDLFVGSRLFVSTELRVDRGEEPEPGPWDVRIDQAFARVGPLAGQFLQVGKFVSPFAGYPQRHHTEADPFIRPPLLYDYRTMVCASVIPANSAAFVDWKDDPDQFRPQGAPPVWGAPYQWGAMVLGAVAAFDYKVAVVNSAPSSEPEEWTLAANPMDRPSFVASAGYRVAPWLRLDLSYNSGPYLEDRPEGPFPAGRTAADYRQIMVWGGALFELGRTAVRVEALHDRWEVPNVPDDAIDGSLSIEAQHTVAPGLFVAGRFGTVQFLPLSASGFTYDGPIDPTTDIWDYDAFRFQAAVGYRIVRNAEIRAEYALNWTDAPGDRRADLLSVQLWWQY